MHCVIVPCVVALLPLSARAEFVEFAVTIDGFQASVETTATGSGTVLLNTTLNVLHWSIDYQNLSGPLTAAHFHGAAGICEPAGVQLGISGAGPATGSIMGSAAISPQQEADLLTGLWYVNLHTELNPAGEARGQVVPTPLGDPVPNVPEGSVRIFLQTLATGLTAPNWGTHAPGHPQRLFVTDQPGILWAIDLGTGEKTVFLDVSNLIVGLGIFGPNTFDERGLLGVAFHPDYLSNGLLYTYTSEPDSGEPDFSTMPEGADPNHQTLIREWTVPNPADPASVVDPGSTRVLLRIDQPQFNHDGGALSFGHDGMLYISLGDGGAADDQESGIDPFGVPNIGHGCLGNGRDPATILGTVIRIDPGGSNAANGQYGVPKDNPFVGVEGFVDEIFAYGFRNPFRFSFDSLSGDLYLADVGQNDIEEVDIVVSGGNYGWNHKEGSFTFIPNGASSGYVTDLSQEAPSDLIDPIAEYDHGDGIAIIGGFVYRGTSIPALVGRYVFGEFAVSFSNDGRLFYLNEFDQVQEFRLVPSTFGRSLLGWGQDAAGEMYVLANGTGVPFGDTGVVLRVAPLVAAADLNFDGVVGIVDLLMLLEIWGPCSGPCDTCLGDIDGNCRVGIGDFLALLSSWG